MEKRKKDSENMPSAKDKEISGITEGIKDISLSPATYFVISTIARVPDDESDSDSPGDSVDSSGDPGDDSVDSSGDPGDDSGDSGDDSGDSGDDSGDSGDDSADSSSDDTFFEGKCLQEGSVYKREVLRESFTTTRPKGRRRKTSEISIEDLPPQEDSVVQGDSVVVAPFLKKLLEKGFDDKEKDKKKVSVSIGLNRMKSLSETKNTLLCSELNKYVETSVRHEKFGFYWICNWYSTKGKKKKVEYETVKSYYEELFEEDPKTAEDFRKEQEKNVPVPYRKLRDHAKNHNKTKLLVNEFREKNCKSNVYLSLIDINTVDFNGIYSAYLRIVASSAEIPTVMTTGYEYPTDPKDGNVYLKASRVDRTVRIKTAEHIPLGVYYPEANMCILIPQAKNTLPENFESQDDYNNKNESPSLIKKLQQGRKNTTFIFSDDNPLIVNIPDRARKTKVHKRLIPFSPEFKEGASPTERDINLFKQVTQSHFNEKVWADALFINGAIKIKNDDPEIKNAFQQCKSLIAKIRKSEEEKEQNICKLKQFIEDAIVNAIVEAIENVQVYVKEYTETNARSEKEEELIQILNKKNISSKKRSLLLSSPVVLRLLKEDIISTRDLIKLNEETLGNVCSEDNEKKIKQMDKSELSEYIRNLLYDSMK